MDYHALAKELISNMGAVRKMKSHKNIEEALHGEAFVLGYIAHCGDTVLPGEIGQNMNVSTARIATALNNLEKKKLITRQIDPTNRRQILVTITQEGKAHVDSHEKTVLAVAAKMLALLGEHDAKEYTRIMHRLAELLPTIEEFV